MRVLKSRREIERMRDAGQVVAEAHRLAKSMLVPGVRTIEIDAAVERLFAERDATPLFKGFPGVVPFPACVCISVNDQVVHGVPGNRALRDGDIVSIDTGCRLKGWCGDAAWTYPVGDVDPLKRRLLDVGRSVLETAIVEMGRCRMWSEVAAKMAAEVAAAGFGMVEQFVGHGIGREMHEDPQVPHYVGPQILKHDFRLEPGLVLAVEPMVNAGTKECEIDEQDRWTAWTKDRKPSVHFEHTIALTADGPVRLTAGVGD